MVVSASAVCYRLVTCPGCQLGSAPAPSMSMKILMMFVGIILQIELDQRPEWGATFMSLAEHCTSVLCCRVTPGQKANIVTLVKKHMSCVIMAIGDGANDVNMIKSKLDKAERETPRLFSCVLACLSSISVCFYPAAHVGVGLAGVEGGQAVQNADYALPQFRFLQRLLLVHGRWSYRRISTFLSYFLFKTCSFALAHIWFGLFNGFSAQVSHIWKRFLLKKRS